MEGVPGYNTIDLDLVTVLYIYGITDQERSRHCEFCMMHGMNSPGPGFQVELETKFAAQAQTWQWFKLKVSELEQQILSQAPLGNRAQVSQSGKTDQLDLNSLKTFVWTRII